MDSDSYADFFLSFVPDLLFLSGFDSLTLVSVVLVSASFFPVSLSVVFFSPSSAFLYPLLLL